MSLCDLSSIKTPLRQTIDERKCKVNVTVCGHRAFVILNMGFSYVRLQIFSVSMCKTSCKEWVSIVSFASGRYKFL